jgi:hypothetical protein
MPDDGVCRVSIGRATASATMAHNVPNHCRNCMPSERHKQHRKKHDDRCNKFEKLSPYTNRYQVVLGI